MTAKSTKLTCIRSKRASAHHTRHAFSLTIGWPALQPKALANSGMFCTTPFTRQRPGECGSMIDAPPRFLVGGVLAPELGEGEEEALLGREAVDLGQVFARDPVHQGHVGDADAAVVGGVLAQRELAVQLHVVDGGEAGILVGDAAGALLERLAVLGRPPVAQVARGRRTCGPGRRSRGSVRGRSRCRCRRSSPRHRPVLA